jgi:Tol biopolymer transport system component
MRGWRGALLAGMLVALAMPSAAEATFPGANGKIAFSSTRPDGGGVYVMNPDGSGQTLVAASGDLPAWSTNGTRLAYSRTSDDSISIASPDGSNVRDLCRGCFNGGPVGLGWSPDGTRIVYSDIVIFSEEPDNAELFTIGTDNSQVSQLTSTTSDIEVFPDWSPNGSKIALSKNGFLATINPDGGGEVLLQGNPAGSAPSWSPDGTRLAYSAFDGTGAAIFVINADGSGATQLTESGAFDRSPAWSPDGTKIAFSSDRDGNDEIYVMNADGTAETRLTNAPGFDSKPDWQPLSGPRREDYRNASQFCKAQRDFLGGQAFGERYGGGANAYGRCVSGKGA